MCMLVGYRMYTCASELKMRVKVGAAIEVWIFYSEFARFPRGSRTAIT